MSSTKPTLMKFSLTLATLALVMAFLAAMAPATTANANETPVRVSALSNLQGHFTKESQASGTYIVVLKEAPLAMYAGGLPGLAPTSLKATGEIKLNAQSAASQAYLGYLAERRQSVIQTANQLLGRPLAISYEYGATLVGFATTLTPAEADLLAGLADVASVEKETISYPLTDAGPSWIGAPEIWGGPWEAIQYQAMASGANEVPPVTTDATATAEFTYNYYTNELHYQIHVDNPDAVNFTAMHIHNGAVGVNGPVVYNFGLTATNETSFSVAGSTTLSDENEGLLANGLLYVNAHSTTNASGEIRGQIELVGSLGEGVLVGIIDTGIDPWNPSFLEVGGDGYMHTNPLGTGEYLGVCDPANTAPPSGVVAYDPTFPCNDKLIGAWGYTASDASPRDTDGHGSHTASTTAGNFVESATITATIVVTANISGVAPHANIIAYDGCSDGGGCPGASLAAARDQALLDGVDVVNYSIGSGSPSPSPWGGAEALQWLALRSAGIFVATSNGNAGPNSSTTGSPADLPWLMSVGASSHNRKFLNELIVTDANGNSIAIEGEAIAGEYGPSPIVWAADFGDNLCLNAFPANTFDGQIVVCERGVNGRVAKGQNALAGGAGGMILAQPTEAGGGPGALASDPHVLPATHIDFYEYQDLLAFEAAAPGNVITGTLQGAYLAIDNSYGDIMASFSSRGPNRAIPDLIVPSVTAPGRAIWAAYHQGSGGDGDYTFNVIQGTSMSSPHAAGTAALMVALHPDWSPAQVQSALMSTSLVDIYNDDGLNPATPFAMGAGRIQVNEAAQAGFVLDITEAEYVGANPANGGEPQQLNNASLGDGNCVGICVWVREIESTLDVASTWVITPELAAGLTMDVEPASFTLPAGGTQIITFTLDATEAEQGVWQFGRVWFTETTPTVYPVVELSKDDGGITATAGTTITYMLHYTNTGDGDAMGVWMTETVPAHTTFNATASSAGWTEVMTDTYTYYIGHLASGEMGMAHFVVNVDSELPTSTTTIENMAYITGEEMTVGYASDSTPVEQDGGPIGYSLYLPNIAMNAPASATAQTRMAVGGGDVPAMGTHTMGIAPVAHFPVAVSSTTCSATNLISIETSETADEGDYLICGETAPVSDLQIELAGLTEGDVYTDSLSVDPTNGDPFDNLNDGTVTAITLTVSNAARLVAQVYESEAPDIDLFVGTGSTPSAATQVCASTSGSFTEYCNINNPADGTWWVVVQNWAGSGSQPDLLEYTIAVVPNSDVENWTVSGPAVVAAGDPLTATIAWDEPGFVDGSRWFGHATFGTDAGNPDNLAEVNVNFLIVAPPPVIEVDPTSLEHTQASGTTSTHDLDISNVGGGMLDWSIDEAGGGAGFVRQPVQTTVVEEVTFTPQAGFGFAASGVNSSAPVGLQASPARVPNLTITQSNSQAIEVGSIACASGGLHADNSYFRAFDLPTFGVNAPFVISDVTVGVETANGASGSQPVVLRLYAAPSGTAFPAAFPGSFTQIASQNVTVNNQTVSLLSIPVAATVPGDSLLVVELFTPSGIAINNAFFIGSNNDGQTAPGYLAAPSCGISTPTNIATIGFPNMHIVMNVTGEEGVPSACDTPSDVAWLSVAPSSGSTAAGATDTVVVTLDSSGLPAGVYTSTLCIDSNDTTNSTVEFPVSMTVTGAGSSAISLDTTVGTDSSVCASTDGITVASGTMVYYCYEVTNTGTVTLTLHDLMDTELGTLLNAFPYNLAPSASAFITASTVITESTVSTSTWTAYNAGPTDTATDTDTATVTVSTTQTVTYCRNGANIPIPDNNPAGVDDTQTVAEFGTITDVNVTLNGTHTYMGDLIFTLTHNATSVDLISEPNNGGGTCSGNDFVNLVFNDEPAGAPGTSAQATCASGTNPAQAYQANGHYTPAEPLSALDSGEINGVWTLNASDHAGADTGTIADWCVIIEYEPAP